MPQFRRFHHGPHSGVVFHNEEELHNYEKERLKNKVYHETSICGRSTALPCIACFVSTLVCVIGFIMIFVGVFVGQPSTLVNDRIFHLVYVGIALVALGIVFICLSIFFIAKLHRRHLRHKFERKYSQRHKSTFQPIPIQNPEVESSINQNEVLQYLDDAIPSATENNDSEILSPPQSLHNPRLPNLKKKPIVPLLFDRDFEGSFSSPSPPYHRNLSLTDESDYHVDPKESNIYENTIPDQSGDTSNNARKLQTVHEFMI